MSLDMATLVPSIYKDTQKCRRTQVKHCVVSSGPKGLTVIQSKYIVTLCRTAKGPQGHLEANLKDE